MSDTITVPMTAGIVIRREIRRYLQREGLSFTEDKGWIDSQFMVSGPRDRVKRAFDAIARTFPD